MVDPVRIKCIPGTEPWVYAYMTFWNTLMFNFWIR